MNKKKKIDQRGGIVVFTILLLPVLLAFSSLSIDIWNFYLVRNQMQAAADAAALAAATNLYRVNPGDVALATAKANSITQANNFTHGVKQTTVTVSIPPGDPYNKSPNYANNSSYARVRISQSVPLFFGKLIGMNTKTVSVNAVAGPAPLPLALLTTATSGSGSFSQTGSAVITAVGGPIAINSNSTTALTKTGSGTIAAQNFYIYGGYSGSLSGTVSSNTQTLVSNPFSGLALPQPPFSCNYTNYSTSSGTVTLSPGNYCGGITISGSGTVTFNPGTYILYGKGLSITGSAKVSGTGVVFYNTGTSTGTYAYGSYSVTGSGKITFSAPTSGKYMGMLFMQDPLNTKAASITGSATNSFAGNIYLPNGGLTVSGSGTMTVPIGVVVVSTFKQTGSGNIKVSNTYGGPTQISLYE